MQLIMNTKLQWMKRKWTKEISPLTVIRKTNKLRNIFSCYLDVWLRRNECLRISMIVFFFPSTFIHRGMILQEFFVNLSIRRRISFVLIFTRLFTEEEEKSLQWNFVCGSNDALRKYFASDGKKKVNTAKCVCVYSNIVRSKSNHDIHYIFVTWKISLVFFFTKSSNNFLSLPSFSNWSTRSI